jgi:hypothetical protein
VSAKDILDELPRLSPSELAALRRSLEALPEPAAIREMPGTGIRPTDYEDLFGSLAHDPDFEIPERHPWRPAPRFD